MKFIEITSVHRGIRNQPNYTKKELINTDFIISIEPCENNEIESVKSAITIYRYLDKVFVTENYEDLILQL